MIDDRVLIFQRVVPHYRVALFQRLHELYGWRVLARANRQVEGLQQPALDPPWLLRTPLSPRGFSPTDVRVPFEQGLRGEWPTTIIAEFSPRLSTTWQLALSRLAGKRPRNLVFWSHGRNMDRGFANPVDLASQAARLALLQAADAHLCYSVEGANYVRRFTSPKHRVFVAPNTIDIDSLPGRNIDRSPRDSASAALLFVGRLTHDKRVPRLIEAFSVARRKHPGLTLTIIGDGPDRAEVHARAAQVGTAVRCLGPLYDTEQLAGYFQEASALVYAGSIGLAANHALAFGVPVIIYDRPSAGARHHPEHCYVLNHKTGIRVAQDSVEALATCLDNLATLRTPLRQQLRLTIAEVAAKELRLEAMLDGFAELQRWVAGSN